MLRLTKRISSQLICLQIISQNLLYNYTTKFFLCMFMYVKYTNEKEGEAFCTKMEKIYRYDNNIIVWKIHTNHLSHLICLN